jgi:RsiW-degrading membrane proteinase PrsW (M82 family)
MFGLSLIGLLLLGMLRRLGRDIRTVRRLSGGSVWTSPLARAGLVFLLLVTVPAAFVQWSPFGGALAGSADLNGWAASVLALLISYTWYRYLTWLDTFEREGRAWELGVFLLGCVATPLTFPLGAWVISSLDLALYVSFWGDLLYCVIGIGLVEETVKLLPLLAIVLFTRQANEPFDLILYGSISALGFAFIENTLYLSDTGLFAVGGRAIMASVAHMFFTSIIAYTMALARHRGAPLLPAVLLGLVLASAAHGFYNLWLISPFGPAVFTLVFYLFSIHLWVVMKNNLINLSPHYQEQLRPRSVMFRYRIVNALLAILLCAFVLKFLLEGRAEAFGLLQAQGSVMGATMLYLAVSFSELRFIPGYIAPLRPRGSLFAVLFPEVRGGEDLTGRRLLMRIPEDRSNTAYYMPLHRMLPLEGRLAQRVLLDDEHEWYLFIPDRPVPFAAAHPDALLVRAFQTLDTLNEDRYVRVAVVVFTGPPALQGGKADKAQLAYAGHVHGKLL